MREVRGPQGIWQDGVGRRDTDKNGFALKIGNNEEGGKTA